MNSYLIVAMNNINKFILMKNHAFLTLVIYIYIYIFANRSPSLSSADLIHHFVHKLLPFSSSVLKERMARNLRERKNLTVLYTILTEISSFLSSVFFPGDK